MENEDATATAVPGWEAAKENVLPVKKGRSAKGLSERFARPVMGPSLEEEQEKAFEDLLRNTTVPLERFEIYSKYLKWTRDTFPSTTEKSMLILERCTCEFKDNEETKNEPKYVMMWIDYADMVRTPGDVFSFMQTNKIGERVALFWVAWAYVAEKALNYKLTDQIFQKGIRRNAEPKDLLSQRYKQFMRRMARLYLNNTVGTDGTSYTESANSNAAVDNAIIQTAMEAIRAQPSVQSGSTSTSAGAAQAAVPGERRAMTTIMGHSNTVTAGATTTGNVPVAGRSSGTTRPGASTSTSRNTSNNAPRSTNVGFEIFSDTPTVGHNISTTASGVSRSTVAPHLYEADRDGNHNSHNTTASAGAPAATWKQLGSEAVRRKENDGPITKWTAGPLFPSAATTTTASIPVASSIPIFVDEEFQQPTATATAAHVVPENVLSVRKQLDAVDVIAKNPLARHNAATSANRSATVDAPKAMVKTENIAPTENKTLPKRAPLGDSALVNASVSVSAEVKAPKMQVQELPVFTSLPHPEVVVPTKVKRDVSAPVANGNKTQGTGGLPFAIFSDTPTSHVSPVKKTVMPIQAAAFSVYESPVHSNNAVNARAKNTAVAKNSAPAMGFAIYSDEPAVPAASTKSTSNKGVTDTTRDNAGLSFAIYSDEPSITTAITTAAVNNDVKKATTASSAGFTIFSDEPVPKKTTSKPTAGFTIFSDEPVANPVSTVPSKGFSIYESPTAKATATAAINKASVNTTTNDVKPATKLTSKPAFDIFVDESIVQDTAPVPVTTTTATATTKAAPSAVSNTTDEHDDELQNLLDNMITLDGEDGTINTRLARRDIDMMFCSPTIHRAPAASTVAKTSLKTTTKDINSSVIYDENAAPFTLKSAPLAALRTPGPSTAFTPYTTYKDQGSFDQFDNDYAEPIPYNTTHKVANNKERVVLYSDSGDAAESHGVGNNKVLSQAQHRPFGTHLETFSAVKDLSAIKSNQEFSMCGMMDTPGHTNTLGFRGGFHHHTTTNKNHTGDKNNNHMDRLLDFDISHSRESIGSICPNPITSTTTATTATTSTKPAQSQSQGSLGFSIFEDSMVVEEEAVMPASHKRKGLSDSGPVSKPYTGLSDALPPSRRRLYNPFQSAVSVPVAATMHTTPTVTATAVVDKTSVISGHHTEIARPASRRMSSDSAAASTKQSTSNRGVGDGKNKSRHSAGSSNSGGNSVGSRVYGIAMYDNSSNNATELGASASDSNTSAHQRDVDVVIHVDGMEIPVIDPLNSSIREDDVVLTPLVPQPVDTVESAHTTINTAKYSTSPLDILVEAVSIRSTSNRDAKRVRRSSSGMSLFSAIDDTTVDAMDTSASVGIGDLCIATATAAATVAKSTNVGIQKVYLNLYEEPEVEVFDPETFHSLESDTFNYIVEQLQLYYTHTATYTPAVDMAIVLKSDTAHPTCFTFRTKVNTQEKYILPHMLFSINTSSSGDKTSTSRGVYKLCSSAWNIVANIGRGSYGHAILMQRTATTTVSTNHNHTSSIGGSVGNRSTAVATCSVERAVYKVDTNRDSVLWEAYIHMQIQLRIQTHEINSSTHNNNTTIPKEGTSTSNLPIPSLYTLYTTYILPPHTLYVYRTCTILGLPYLSFGTLVHALRVLMLKGVFSLAEHEYIVAYLAVQMVQALICVHSAGILHLDVKTDNWLLERCTDKAAECATYSSSTTTNSDNNTITNTAAVGVRVKLIDFGRSLSVGHSSHTISTIDKSSANKGTRHTNPSAQLATLTTLYQPVVTDTAAATSVAATATNYMSNLGKPEVVYQGDISAKGYKCFEMEQSKPWSYQTDLHGLCSCIHQLLHLMPLTLYSDTSDHCRQRGLAIDTTVDLITSHITSMSGGKKEVDKSQLVRELEGKEFLVPQATLKRYWNKPLWGALYLTLLNSALFKPLLSSCNASTHAAPAQAQSQPHPQQDNNKSANYSVVLLDVLTKALQEHISSVPKNIRESAIGKLVAKLSELEL